MFPQLKMIVIDTLQKIRETVETKYGADYRELSVLKSIADQLEIAVVLVHHNRKARDSNPNNLISGTNGIAGCADGLLMFTRSGENAELHISGRGAPALELNLKRKNAKWILLDDPPEKKADIFSFIIHDFICARENVSGTASEICLLLKEKYPGQDFNCNWLYRDLLQHDDEIRSLGIDYGKTKSNGIRSIFIRYDPERDSSSGKILYSGNAVPADTESIENADDHLHEVECAKLPSEENADPAVPAEMMSGDNLIASAAELMRNNLAKQGINVPAFNYET